MIKLDPVEAKIEAGKETLCLTIVIVLYSSLNGLYTFNIFIGSKLYTYLLINKMCKNLAKINK